MKKTTMGWVVNALTIAVVLTAPSDAQSQLSPGAQRATGLESEASKLLNQRDQWAFAVDLYMAAVQLRDDADPKAREDLLVAANLSYEMGNTAGAIAALESAASRALASGEVVVAAKIFTNAVWVAQKEGLRVDQRRLSSRVAELAESTELTKAERSQILARFRGA